MPRYFFRLRNGEGADDPQVEEHPDLYAACVRARAYAVDMAAAGIIEKRIFNPGHMIEVSGDSGEMLYSVRFGDVVKVEGK